MAQQIQELINKIKQDGVEAAQNKAREIEEDAKKKAHDIIEHAKKESERLLRERKAEIQKLEQSSRMNLMQSARDMLLSLRAEIQNVLKKIIDQKVSEALTPENLSSIIGAIVTKALTQEGIARDMQFVLSEGDLKKLKDGFLADLQNRLKKDIKLQASEDVAKGFLISFDGGKSSFDFTNESLARYLSVYLNTQVASLMEEAVKK